MAEERVKEALIIPIIPEYDGKQYILKLDEWQFREVICAIERLNKQRDCSNKWAEKQRNLDAPKNSTRGRNMRPRLVINESAILVKV